MRSSELEAMIRHDDHHWWYRGRRRVLRATLSRLPIRSGAVLLDAGCGSGRTLDELAHHGRVFGVDVDPLAVGAARERGHADVFASSLEQLPFSDAAFDVVTCLDVIEHTPDDRRSLRELLRVTRPGGTLVVTVPAYPSLWSEHDVVNHHYRRYRRGALARAAREAGWAVVSDTHFNSLLLAPAAAVRWARRGRPSEQQRSELEFTPPLLDRVLELPLAAEARGIEAGWRVPFGLSLLAVLRREGVPASAQDAGVPDRVAAGLRPDAEPVWA